MNIEPTWFVIDAQRRVWAACTTKATARKQRKEIQRAIRQHRHNIPHAPDPATLRVVGHSANPLTLQP